MTPTAATTATPSTRSAGGDGADPEPGPRRRPLPRLLWPALIAGGCVLLIGAALLRPGGSIQAPRTESIPAATGVIPGLLPGYRMEQRFEAMADGLSSVSATLVTFKASPTCDLDVSLLDDRGEELGSNRLPCEAITDSERIQLISVPPIEGSAGRWFEMVIEVSDEPSTGVGTGGVDPTTTVPAAVVNDDEQELAVAMITDYGDDTFALSQIPTALERLAQYGPFWNDPVFIVGMVVVCIAALTAMSLARWKWAIVLLVVFAFTKGVLWSAVLPPSMGMDEGAHLAYAQYLAVDHAIPKRDKPANDGPSYSPELDALAAVFRHASAPRSDRAEFGPDGAAPHQDLLDDVRGNDSSNGDTPASGYTPAYYVVPAALYAASPGTIDVKVGAMRLWSVALGAVAAVAAAFLGRRLFARDSTALLLGVAVACQPMLSQQTAVMNNDAMVIASGAVLTLIAVALTDPSRSKWWSAAAGVTFGVAMLAKPLAAAIFPVLLIAWLIGRRRGARDAPWWWEAGAAGLGVIVTYGPWFVLSTFFGYAAVSIPSVDGPDRGVGRFLANLRTDSFSSARSNWIDQFWGNFGWVNQPFDQTVQRIILVACIVGALIVAAWVVVSVGDAVKARRGGGPWRTRPGADLAAGTAVCFLVVTATFAQLYVLMFQYFVRLGSMEFIQGRYALLIVPALLALPVLALRRLVPRLSSLVPMGTITVAMVVLNVIGAGLIIERWYL